MSQSVKVFERSMRDSLGDQYEQAIRDITLPEMARKWFEQPLQHQILCRHIEKTTRPTA